MVNINKPGKKSAKNTSIRKLGGICVLLGLFYSAIPTLLYRSRNYLTYCLKRMRLGKGEKNIYLTFDDGPGCYTEEILDVLRQHQVKATFFMVSDYAREHPEIVRKVRKAGHAIGMHSRKHQNPMLESPIYGYRDLQQGYMDMQGLGVPIRMFRPPWGIVNLSMLLWKKRYHLDMYLWNVMAEDWRGDETAERIAQRLINRVMPGSIICLHDGRGKNAAPLRTARALQLAIPKLKEKGYRFVCLGTEG